MLDVVVASADANSTRLEALVHGDRVWAANAPAALLLSRTGIAHSQFVAPTLAQLARLQRDLAKQYKLEVGGDDLLSLACDCHAVWKMQIWEWRRQKISCELDRNERVRLVFCEAEAVPDEWSVLGESLDLEMIFIAQS
jgi:hypothetical protein